MMAIHATIITGSCPQLREHVDVIRSVVGSAVALNTVLWKCPTDTHPYGISANKKCIVEKQVAFRAVV